MKHILISLCSAYHFHLLKRKRPDQCKWSETLHVPHLARYNMGIWPPLFVLFLGDSHFFFKAFISLDHSQNKVPRPLIHITALQILGQNIIFMY